MRGVAYWFVLIAAVCGLLGMAWGIHMSASLDHTLSPAHAHLNLIGWVSMVVFGFYYHLVPAAGEARLAKIHLAVTVAAVIVFTPGIVFAIRGDTELFAKLGALLTMVSMAIFVFTAARNRVATSVA